MPYKKSTNIVSIFSLGARKLNFEQFKLREIKSLTFFGGPKLKNCYVSEKKTSVVLVNIYKTFFSFLLTFKLF